MVSLRSAIWGLVSSSRLTDMLAVCLSPAGVGFEDAKSCLRIFSIPVAFPAEGLASVAKAVMRSLVAFVALSYAIIRSSMFFIMSNMEAASVTGNCSRRALGHGTLG